MCYSEIFAVALVYSGLFIYFLFLLRSKAQREQQRQEQSSFLEIFKTDFKTLIFHKKATLALVFFSFVLYVIWATFTDIQNHTNAQSGLPPISYKNQAIFTILGVILYTTSLTLLAVFNEVPKSFQGQINKHRLQSAFSKWIVAYSFYLNVELI